MKTNPSISVIIATRNRSESLARLLKSLTEQFNAPPFEVIIGDNGSSDDTTNVIERAKTSLKIHSVREDRPGKSRALNAALKLARGDLIVFTDDDVQPYPDWLAQMHAAALAYPECNFFGGRIDVNLEAVPEWVQRSFNLMSILTSAHNIGDVNIRYPNKEYPFGPNMAVRRHIIKDAHYPEHVGPGTALPVGDESCFLSKLSPPGTPDRLFVPSAAVMHEIENENISFKGALIRCYLQGLSHGQIGFFDVSPEIFKNESALKLIVKRTMACRSIREFICISVRYLGFIKGKAKSKIK